MSYFSLTKNSLVSIFIYLFATAFLFYEMGLQVSPSVMDAFLMHDLNIGAREFGIMSAWYFYSYTIMQVPAGVLYDIFGPRKLISFFCALCGAGALFFGYADSVFLASLGRFFMGIGSAFAFIGVLVCAHRWFSSGYFALLVGIAQFLAAFGAIGGELPLAYFVNVHGWRAVMIALGGIGILLSVACYSAIRNQPDVDGGSRPVHDPVKFSFIEKFSIAFSHVKAIFSSWQTLYIGLYAFCSWAPIAIFAALWGVPYIMRVHGYTNTYAAFLVSFVWIGIAFTAPFLGWISDTIRNRKSLLLLCAATGACASSLFLFVNFSLPIVYLLLFLVGAASSGQILTFALIRDISRPSSVGSAIGVNNMAVVAGGAFFQPLVGYILHVLWKGVFVDGVPYYDSISFQYALISIPLCYLIAFCVCAFGIKETHAISLYPQDSE